MNSYISVDIEATGLSPRRDKIIEIGAIKVRDGKEIATFSTFVNPGRKLDERITELTKIRDEDLSNAPFINEIIEDFVVFTEDLPLIGHHVITDFAIIKQAAVNNKLSFEKEAVDTLRIARACLPELPSKRLGDVCAYYGIELEAHRALNDARATLGLYERLKSDFKEKEPALFKPLKLNHQVKKESPIRKNQIERINMLIERYNLECPYEIEKMSMSEAGRYIDIILANHSNKNS